MLLFLLRCHKILHTDEILEGIISTLIVLLSCFQETLVLCSIIWHGTHVLPHLLIILFCPRPFSLLASLRWTHPILSVCCCQCSLIKMSHAALLLPTPFFFLLDLRPFCLFPSLSVLPPPLPVCNQSPGNWGWWGALPNPVCFCPFKAKKPGGTFFFPA